MISVDEVLEERADLAIAEAAITRLRRDLAQGFDHLILARVDGISQTGGVASLYQRLGPEFRPVVIHSDLLESQRRPLLNMLETRQSRIIICVDMFGEGFDLPQLKIAAMHDIHRSLPITLQFIGRFVRTEKNVGEATAVVNIADPATDAELQSLYSQSADWNVLLRRSSEERIAREIALHDFIESFSGNLPAQLPLWNLRPSFSTLVFRSAGPWTPHNCTSALPRNSQAWIATSQRERVVVAVLARDDQVKWGRYQNIKDRIWDLLVVHWNEELGLLFVHCSDYDAVNTSNVAKAVGGPGVIPLSGSRVFRVFSGVERPMVKNLGAAKTGTISFTMYFGPEVAAGLSQVERAESQLRNLFGWGYEAGERVTFGCAERKGKLWSQTGGPITGWKNWCQTVGRKLLNDTVQDADLISGFLRPQELPARPVLVPLSVDWGERILLDLEERGTVCIGHREFPLHEVSLSIAEHLETGPLVIAVIAQDVRVEYELHIDPSRAGGFDYVARGPVPVEVQFGRRERLTFDAWCREDPVVITYADGSVSYNRYYVPAPCDAVFATDLITAIDWTGTDIHVESQGMERLQNSIQYRMAESCVEECDVVFNDDASGEAADIITLAREHDGDIVLRFVHCKFAKGDGPRAQVDDLYELCGQAQKCVRWKHRGLKALVNHMVKRERTWQAAGHTRFIKGGWQQMKMFEKMSRFSRVRFEVTIVQPGLDKSRVSDPILRLLGATELYLKKTADARFDVVCGD